jgi:hypothetical protein
MTQTTSDVIIFLKILSTQRITGGVHNENDDVGRSQ